MSNEFQRETGEMEGGNYESFESFENSEMRLREVDLLPDAMTDLGVPHLGGYATNPSRSVATERSQGTCSVS